jgi:hypothetical protein
MERLPDGEEHMSISEKVTINGFDSVMTRQNTVAASPLTMGSVAASATVGDFRCENGTTILACRNAANSADLTLISSSNADSITICPTTAIASVVFGNGTSSMTVFGTTIAIEATSDVYIDGSGIHFRNASHTEIIAWSAASLTATSANAGSNGAVPAQVVGYLITTINGAAQKIPYFAT